jgi:hypothetical protein
VLVRTGSLANPRMVKLSCLHELPHPTKDIGDKIACRECRPKRVYRSRLNDHTISPWRGVIEVLSV